MKCKKGLKAKQTTAARRGDRRRRVANNLLIASYTIFECFPGVLLILN